MNVANAVSDANYMIRLSAEPISRRAIDQRHHAKTNRAGRHPPPDIYAGLQPDSGVNPSAPCSSPISSAPKAAIIE